MIWSLDKNAAVKLTAIALALATVVFVNMAIVHRIQTAQVGEGVASASSTADDAMVVGSIAPSWYCAGVSITLQCSRTQAYPGVDLPGSP
jgi:hypothetical protein